MANICTNILWISGIKDEKQMQRFIEKIGKTFECFYEDEGENFCEIGFNSKNNFPEAEMRELAIRVDTGGIQIGVISYDFSVNYVAYHLYRNGIWSKVL